MNTNQLVKSAKKGDKEALVKLIMAQKEDYYKLAYVYMKNEDDAMDAMQDMIVILYENIHSLKNGNLFYSWSKTILVNCCKNSLRKNKKIVYLANVKEKSEDSTISQIDEEIILEEYLSRLSFKHAEVLRLKYFLDLDEKTISQILDLPIGTVKSRTHNGLKKLKESFGGVSL